MIGKHYLLTGATGSLGESMIQSLNNHGAYVSIIVRNEDKANHLMTKYQNIKEVFILDMNDTAQVEQFSLAHNNTCLLYTSRCV